MRRALGGGWLLVAGCFVGCSAGHVPRPEGAYAIPVEKLGAASREKLAKVLEDPTCMVELERTAVKSRPEVYAFLLEDLPFAAGVLRALGQAEYVITRDGQGGYVLNDQAGVKVRAEPLSREERRWVYYTYGYYDIGLFRVYGRSVIIVLCEPRGAELLTEARVYAKIENKMLEAGALAMRDSVEQSLQQKAFVFVRAARLVAELAARDPQGLHDSVFGSKDVDPASLEEFRRRFVP